MTSTLQKKLQTTALTSNFYFYKHFYKIDQERELLYSSRPFYSLMIIP